MRVHTHLVVKYEVICTMNTCLLSDTEDDTLSWHKISQWDWVYLNYDDLSKLCLESWPLTPFFRAASPLQGEVSCAQINCAMLRAVVSQPEQRFNHLSEGSGRPGCWGGGNWGSLHTADSTCTTGRKTHHAVSSQEVWDHVFVHVVYQPSWTLVVIPTVNEELLPCVLIDEGTDLK